MRKFYAFILKLRNKRIYSRPVLMVATILLSGFSIVNAQVAGYSFAQSSGTFIPLTSGTALAVATGNASATNLNSEVHPVTLPFNFIFNATSYSTLNVTTNGFITFGTTPPLATTTTPISGTVAYDGAISAFGKDISSYFDVSGLTGSINWEVVGTSPNREVVIEWKNFRTNTATAITSIYSFSFQIRLQETSNVIKMVYDSGSYIIGSTAVAAVPQIGLRGSTNIDFNNRLNPTTVAFTSSIEGTANSSTQATSTSNATPGMPTAGLTYTWTPPSCFLATNLAAGTSTVNSIPLTWTASSSAPGGYDIYYSTTNTQPVSSTPPVLTNVPGTSVTLNSLPPSTIYYVWIRSNCGSGSTSIWSQQPLQAATACIAPAVLSTTGDTVCPNSTATLSATVDPGADLTWYDAVTAGNQVGTGPAYTTPALTTTTDYWVTASNIGADGFVGKTAPTATSGNSTFVDYGLVFDAYTPMIIREVDVYPMHATNTTGTVTFNLKDPSGNIIQSKTETVNVSAAGILNTVVLNFNVPLAGSGYRLVVDGATGISNLRREISSGFAYPYTLAGVCSITIARFGATNSASYYYYLYNWKVAPKCESSRTMVTATVNCLGTSETNAKDLLKVYPNPFTDILNISDIEKVKSISVSDLSGRVLKTILKPSSQINLTELTAGMYLVNLQMKDGSVQTVKVIKK